MRFRLCLTLALVAFGCSDILPVETIDLCEGNSYSASCAACRKTPPDPKCKNATDGGGGTSGSGRGGDGGSGTGGTSGDGGSSGAGGTSDGGAQCDSNGDCGAPTPYCDEPNGRCVECLNNTNCGTQNEVCDEEEGVCVECTKDGDCDDLSEPQCEDNACVACTGNAACEGRGDTELCDTEAGAKQGECVACLDHDDCDNPTPQCSGERECVVCTSDAACTDREGLTECNQYSDAEREGQCVLCTGDNEADACGTKACKHTTGTCTTVNRGSRTACQSCEADSECAATARCVTQAFGADTFGPYCFFVDDTTHDCADIDDARRPYSRSTERTSLDGVTADYCLPPTTCKAVEDATAMGANGGKTCVSAADCGEDDVDDGFCPTSGAAMNKCSYGCDDNGTMDNYDCPNTGFTTCGGGGANLFCQP